MNKKLLLFVLLVVLFLPFNPAFAKGLYVRDWLNLTVRTSPSPEAGILAMANTNDFLEIIEEQGDWSKVRTPKGKVGWVLNRYLTSNTPKALIVSQLSKKVKSQTDTISELREDNKRLRKEAQKFKFGISGLNTKVDRLTKDYEDLKNASATYLELKAAHDKLLEETKIKDMKMEDISKENRRLKTSERLAFTFIGGGFIIFGLLIGIFIQSLRSRPKKATYKF
ncbi:MAG: TIGR04211 family SH3 domain-containing protein [Thermodesulfobacteriota bacterium]|nr:TIGR04211 family SH3 domain-containing protein [Thermodesulfobacteriota bacterium]